MYVYMKGKMCAPSARTRKSLESSDECHSCVKFISS